MPNWCKGSLKVRGKISDLKKFVQQGLEPVSYIGDALEPLVFTTEDETSFFVRENKVSLWMKGTYRHFCEPNYIEVYADDQETPVIMILPMKAAWSIDAEPLQELCKKFHVDMKIQGFERGMEFSQVIEIVDGEIVQDEELHYNDWNWDCPCPEMGGVKPMKKQIDICATCVHDEPGYCSVIGTIPHCCSRHWHCEPGKAAKDYVPKQEEGEADGKG